MSNQDDYYGEIARHRMQQIQAERAACLADLEAHRLNGDRDSAAQAVQQLADIDAAAANLQGLYQRYVDSQRPPAPPYETEEEIKARPWQKMTPDNGLALAQTSKYANRGAPIDWNNPDVQAGYRESQRRKSRAE